MKDNIYLYILVMAGVTYLIRVLPLTLIRRPIKSRFFRSFLYYVPYVTLSVMTFPGTQIPKDQRRRDPGRAGREPALEDPQEPVLAHAF